MNTKCNDSTIAFRIQNRADGCEISLTHIESLIELAAELEATLEICQASDVVPVALLPPMPPGISARSAFRMIVDTWLAADPAARPSLECVVASQSVVDALSVLMPGGSDGETDFQIGRVRVVVIEGDITAVGADAVVNASNTSLRLGGGVSGALRQVCGPGLTAEMASIAHRHPLADGDAVVTGGHRLQTAHHIIHAASAAGDEETVRRSLRNVFRLSAEYKFANVALPALGTGTGGMRISVFAELLHSEILRHSESGAAFPRLLRLALFRRSHAIEVSEVLLAKLRAAKG